MLAYTSMYVCRAGTNNNYRVGVTTVTLFTMQQCLHYPENSILRVTVQTSKIQTLKQQGFV